MRIILLGRVNRETPVIGHIEYLIRLSHETDEGWTDRMGERNNIVVNGIHGNFQSCPVVLYRRFVYLIISTMGGHGTSHCSTMTGKWEYCPLTKLVKL